VKGKVENTAPAACEAMDSRKLSPPEEALLEGLELVAEIERWTPRCDGDVPLPPPPPAVEARPSLGGAPPMLRKEIELPDREPSLSNCKCKKINKDKHYISVLNSSSLN